MSAPPPNSPPHLCGRGQRCDGDPDNTEHEAHAQPGQGLHHQLVAVTAAGNLAATAFGAVTAMVGLRCCVIERGATDSEIRNGDEVDFLPKVCWPALHLVSNPHNNSHTNYNLATSLQK